MAMVCGLLLLCWMRTQHVPLLVAGIAAAALMPLWYLVPAKFRVLFGREQGRKIYVDEFTPALLRLSAIGNLLLYGSLLAELAVWVFGWRKP